MSTDVNHGLNSAVGTILRRRREALDLELAQIARTLRIRRDYLAALENNTLEGLPGPTYAVGFLRTYSEYLGLDGVDMVQRYKATTDVLNDKPSLTFPMPLTERGVPGGGLFLLTTLVLIGLGYGTWYYISSGRHQTLATVEPVPAQLAAIAPPPQQQAPHTPGAPATAATNVAGNAAPIAAPAVPNTATPGLPASPAPAARSASGQVNGGQVNGGQATTAPDAAPTIAATSTQANSTQASSSQANPAAAMPPDIQQATGGQPNAGQTAPSNQPVAGQEAAAPSAMTSAAPDEGQNAAQSQSNLAANGQPASATAASAAEPAPAGHVYGQPKPARVVAHATAKSWIQVSDASGKVLTTRTMQEGDVYNAPDEKGLVMWTGNAGALQFTVDGHPEPRVGRLGESMRHVSLDPSSISHGTIQ